MFDPKQAWADEHLLQQPLEVMSAEREQLLRIPGVGPIGANAIISARRRGALSELLHLKQIGIRSPQKSREIRSSEWSPASASTPPDLIPAPPIWQCAYCCQAPVPQLRYLLAYAFYSHTVEAINQ